MKTFYQREFILQFLSNIISNLGIKCKYNYVTLFMHIRGCEFCPSLCKVVSVHMTSIEWLMSIFISNMKRLNFFSDFKIENIIVSLYIKIGFEEGDQIKYFNSIWACMLVLHVTFANILTFHVHAFLHFFERIHFYLYDLTSTSKEEKFIW